MLFTQPAYLLLMLPVIAGLVASHRHIHGMAPARKKLAFALRFLMATCIIVALAGPEARRHNHGTRRRFLLVDRSDSISEADRAKEERFVTSAVFRASREDDEAAVDAFGADARLEVGEDGVEPAFCPI